MGREKSERALRVPKREGREPKANPDEEQEVPRLEVLPTEVRACPHSNVFKRFGQQDDDQCWLCGETAQTREHLFRHCKKWKKEQQELWKAVGQETAGRRGGAGTCK
jgi:hypothetical protein